jgi:hypothetical protein
LLADPAIPARTKNGELIPRALTLLLAEINTRPPKLPGDGRPITYTLRQPW